MDILTMVCAKLGTNRWAVTWPNPSILITYIKQGVDLVLTRVFFDAASSICFDLTGKKFITFGENFDDLDWQEGGFICPARLGLGGL